MASEPVNGAEGIDGAREQRSLKVYTRKGKGQRKQSPFFVLEGTIENPEGNDNNYVNPPETLARESVDPIVGVKNSVEEADLRTNSQGDDVANIANNSIEAPSGNLLVDDSDKVIDKPLVEAFSQAEPRDDVTDKNGPVGQDDVNSVVGDEAGDVPSQSQKTQEDVNTVVVDENSIKEPSKNVADEDGTPMIVDKNPIEAPSQTLSAEDVNTLVVDKNPIEDVHMVGGDNILEEAHPENVVEIDDTDSQQPAGLTSDSAHATADESVPMEEDADGRVRIHVASTTKQQKEEIMKKLEAQLNVVRGMVKKIEDKEGEIGAHNDSSILINAGTNNGGGRILSGVTSAALPREVVRGSRPINQPTISVSDNTQGVNEYVEKEKRTPKANQFYRNSEFLLGDKLPPAESNKKSKLSSKKQGGDVGHGFVPGSKVFKNCSNLLERLMKHKHGWVFNAPVDVKALGLHDYFTIIKHPMDLGTIKSALTKNLYKSPLEFAEDVRLVFHNAMTYNPEGQDVHVMAVTLLQIFEERWAVIEADYNREMRFVAGYEMNLSTPTMRSRLGPTMPPPPINVRNTINRADWSNRQPTTTPGRTPTSARTPALKKPKANEPNKRDMTYEEKQKLSGHLQNLPPDKLDAVVQIINKRNTAVKLRDEEIEVDIDSVDPETLWELDRFVTNYKKGLSKKKRKAELALQAKAEAERNSQQQMAPVTEAHEFSREGGNTAKKTLPTPLPSQVEKQNNEPSKSSSSSSSSSGSSSSSDSDSSSSSSSGSDQT